MFSELHPQIKQHVLAEFPREACGLVYFDGEKPVYKPCENLHEEPERHFRIDPRLTAPLMRDGKLLAVVHSHPNGPHHPSRTDMEAQISLAVPYGLTVTDGENCSPILFWSDDLDPPPLYGREFRHGPSGTDGRGDCYALVRDHYRTKLGLILPEYPRDAEWWEHGGNLYLDFVRDAGFVEARLEDIRDHDVVFMTIMSAVPNHAAVYIAATDTVAQHFSFRLSHADDPLGKWHRQIHSVWRHHSLIDPEVRP